MRSRVLLLALALLVGAAHAQDRKPPDRAPKVGDAAPDFTLKKLGDAKTEVTLSSFKGKKPVVLIFGSFT